MMFHSSKLLSLSPHLPFIKEIYQRNSQYNTQKNIAPGHPAGGNQAGSRTRKCAMVWLEEVVLIVGT